MYIFTLFYMPLESFFFYLDIAKLLYFKSTKKRPRNLSRNGMLIIATVITIAGHRTF